MRLQVLSGQEKMVKSETLRGSHVTLLRKHSHMRPLEQNKKLFSEHFASTIKSLVFVSNSSVFASGIAHLQIGSAKFV